MNFYHKYWYFKEAISPRTCDEIIRYGLSQKNREQIAIAISNRELNLTKSYACCMFRNTQPMLEDCLTILEECGDVEDAKEYQGGEEERARDRVVEIACEIAEMYGGMEYE